MINNHQWIYKGFVFVFNKKIYQCVNVKAYELKENEYIVIRNGWKVEGIGKILKFKNSKYEEAFYLETKINNIDYSFYLHYKENVTKIKI